MCVGVTFNQCVGDEGYFPRPTCVKGQGEAQQSGAERAWPRLVVGSELHLVGRAVIEAYDGVAGLTHWECDEPRRGGRTGYGGGAWVSGESGGGSLFVRDGVLS